MLTFKYYNPYLGDFIAGPIPITQVPKEILNKILLHLKEGKIGEVLIEENNLGNYNISYSYYSTNLHNDYLELEKFIKDVNG